ncbi:MAG: isoprenyl transferase [Streptococcaceae bacterium]|jgi:undecaprenyl diphosphate synthase|nr:isoprenyl transferase [Streptococcaceae bacterium]
MFTLFSRKRKKKSVDLEFDESLEIPKHIAIIMDGNGRWAKKRKLPRIAGHKEGVNTVKKVAKAASKLGVKVLTLYAFSTENWQRPDSEVNFLMKLPVDFFDNFVPDLIKENVKVSVIGYIDELPKHTQKAVLQAIDKTKNNTGMILNFAFNYGSRAEILTATQKIAKKVAKGELKLDAITEETFSDVLMTGVFRKDVRDPEILIRSSGEERISNFLLWQIAYSELYFTDELWPDFDEHSLKKAIASYQKRNRRFGGI